MKVMLLGASGLTGGMVLEELLASSVVSQVVAPLRRELSIKNEKLQQVVLDLDQLDAQERLFQVDAILCCLGSTIKKAGSKERFRAIDCGIPLKAAELGRKQGVGAYILMSAVGASSSSPVFYNRVKGELEDGLKALEFPYLSIYQPGLLMTERSEQRTAESLGIKAMPAINCLLQGPMKRYRGIEAQTVAKAMVTELISLADRPPNQPPEVHVRQFEAMTALAGRS
ncbi:NAD(P)H-binding protein [Marinobacter sp. CHS3-4]|uniref:NAD(P)H-binding protein n=1 Tax=Marinobacter sp. CHS3-4 TaxID=3045174 RepID=UPI0024B50840|nr:NAD(P)H-binding protein [Marinobacter sp. CHS3-4]MDI9246384.1 NAD(P)H-binding protein [Marinobacter sp. CHS3-4]